MCSFSGEHDAGSAGYLLVSEIGFFSGDAAPSSLQLPGLLLKSGHLFSGGGARGGTVISGLHGVWTLIRIIVHHLILPL